MLKTRIQFFAIDAVRLFSAFIVLMNHWAQFARSGGVTQDNSLTIFGNISAFSDVGAIGVETFFIISGFVIAMSASGIGKPPSPRHFLTMRAIRLFPALWLSAAIAFFARTMSGEPVRSMAFATMRSSVLSPIGPYIDGVVWSLVVEAVFYILVGVLILSGPRWRLERLAIYLGVLSTIYIIALSLLSAMPHLAISAQYLPLLLRFPFKVLLLRHGVFFAAGMLLWSMKSTGFDRHKMAIMGIFLLAGLAEVVLSVERTLAFRVMAAALWMVSVAAVLGGVVWGEWLEARLKNRRKIMQFMGGISYPIYLNHYSLGMVLVALFFQRSSVTVSTFLLPFALIMGTSIAVFAIERPAQRKLKRMLAN
jgi:peptidoglycan/LPS O-acetylase OafA/YrhL